MNIMSKCSRYIYCNAPKCPLDEHKNLRVRLTGEDICSRSVAEIREIKKMAKISDNLVTKTK